MKDKSVGKVNDEFVELKSKMYSIKYIDGKESNTAKGVNIATVLNEFKDTLFNKKALIHKVRRIQSKKLEIDKISLSCIDDKRSVSDDGIHTVAYFHKDLYKQILTNKKRVLIKKYRFAQMIINKKRLKRFSQLIIDDQKQEEIQKDSHKKKRFKKIFTKRRDSHRQKRFKKILAKRKNSQRQERFKKILTKEKIFTDNQRFRQIKISACK